METDHSDKVYAFDSLFTTNHIQMLKVLASYLQPPMQGRLAIYIRFLELTYTFRFFMENPHAGLPASTSLSLFSGTNAASPSFGNLSGLLDEILPFCDLQEKEKLQNFRNIFQSMQNMQEMMQIFEMMQDISPEFFGSGGSQGDPNESDPYEDSTGTTTPENRNAQTRGSQNASPRFPGFTPSVNWSEFSQMMDMMQELQNMDKPEQESAD